MPRKKRSASPFELMDEDFDEDASSQCSRNGNPPMRNAANARERARMRVLSSAFGRLKTKLPNIPADTKLSKLDTLRLATMYIKQLKTVVEGGSPLAAVANATTHGDHLEGASILSDNCYLNLHNATQSMNWPFGLHHQLHTATTTRTTTHSSPPNSGTSTTPSWCHTETNDLKHQQPTHYDTENYQHHESSDQQNTSAYLSSQLQSVVNGQNGLEPQWYSETPSPELSNNSSSPGGMGYDNTHHHAQQRNNLMEHLSLIQLSTPPPPQPPHSSSAAVTTHSSTSQSFQDNHQLAHHRHVHDNHHMHVPQQHHHHHHLQHHMQHHRHQHTSSQHLHQNFVNPANFAATSIH